MRTIPDAFAARLAAGGTQFAHAWVLKRTDGVTMGFTDHDQDILVEDIKCIAATGLDAKDFTTEIGLAPGGGEVMGALQAASLSEVDIVGGAYDGAEVRLYLCDCETPYDAVLLDTFTIGEIKRDEMSFVAELRGIAHKLSEELGRSYQQRCDADFGDARCGIDLKRTDLTGTGQIDAMIVPGRFRVSGLASFQNGAFNNGTVIFKKWPARRFGVKLHAITGQTITLDLWLAPDELAIGDSFSITMGCDKSFEMCSQRFSNALNYRGFPHMPGNQIVLTMIQDGEPGYDGGSLFHG